jgi:AraC-like DNA-binding protein
MKLLAPIYRSPTAPPSFHSVKRDDESFRLFEIKNADSGCSWHFHPEFQIGYVVQGRGERVVGDCVHAIESGEVVLLGPNLPHVWRYSVGQDGQNVDAIAIHFREDFLGNDFLRKPELRDVVLLLSRAGQGLQIVGSLRKEIVPMLEQIRIQSGFARLMTLLSILDRISRSRDVLTLCSPLFQPIQAELEIERLRRVCDYVKSNFHCPLDRDTAADFAHMSPSAFSRFFKAHTGLTFHDFVAEVRVGNACQLLVSPNYPITDIALDCGFADLSTFNRTFRKLRKMTPSEYRSKLLGITTLKSESTC